MLLPTLIAALHWLVAFPLLSTLTLWRLHRVVVVAHSADISSGSSSSSSIRHGSSASSTAAVSVSPSALHAWSLASSLLSPYHASCWYFDQLLLARRLLLVLILLLVPSGSLYLPLLLLSVIQLSAMLQHRMQPYSSRWLNIAELCSLYLLLLTYMTVLVLQSSIAISGTDATVAAPLGWVTLLFLLNGAFLFALLAGLFALFRRIAADKIAAMRKSVTSCWTSQSRDGKQSSHKHKDSSSSSSSSKQADLYQTLL